jgi:hypothetical protein
LKELALHARTIAVCLQGLIETESCSVSVYTVVSKARISRQPANPAMRLAKIAKAVANFKADRDVQWIVLRLAALAEQLETKKLWAASCVAAAKLLGELGYLDMDEGKRFVAAMKSNAMNDPSDLDDFDTLSKVVKVLPRQTFTKSELAKIRESYSDFADVYAVDCGLSDPEEIREEASRIESIGDSLGVNTDSAQESLRDAADEIQTKKEHNMDWDSDDESRGHRLSDECSDSELDSMFGTLGN